MNSGPIYTNHSRYELVKKIGEGSSADVYLAKRSQIALEEGFSTQNDLNELYAVKLMDLGGDKVPEMVVEAID